MQFVTAYENLCTITFDSGKKRLDDHRFFETLYFDNECEKKLDEVKCEHLLIIVETEYDQHNESGVCDPI